MISEYEFSMPLGWKCPCCGHVFNPTTPECPYCSNSETTVTAAGTMPILSEWQQFLKTLQNIKDYPYDIKNPSNTTDSDTFQLHLNNTTIYKE